MVPAGRDGETFIPVTVIHGKARGPELAMDKPTILVEIGQNGSRDGTHVAAIVAGVENALSMLGMPDAPPREAASPARLFKG